MSERVVAPKSDACMVFCDPQPLPNHDVPVPRSVCYSSLLHSTIVRSRLRGLPVPRWSSRWCGCGGTSAYQIPMLNGMHCGDRKVLAMRLADVTWQHLHGDEDFAKSIDQRSTGSGTYRAASFLTDFSLLSIVSAHRPSPQGQLVERLTLQLLIAISFRCQASQWYVAKGLSTLISYRTA
jgi:hypothetical protein